jgi:hypothetical protein
MVVSKGSTRRPPVGSVAKQKRLGELRDVCRWLVELTDSPSDGRLGARGVAIVDSFKALRTVWPEPYVSKYERKLLEAIDARDEPRMAQALLDFIVYNGVKELQDRTERLRNAQRKGALIAAGKKRGRPSPGELRLNEYRKNTKTQPTKATKVLADEVSLSPSRLRWLLRHKR